MIRNEALGFADLRLKTEMLMENLYLLEVTTIKGVFSKVANMYPPSRLRNRLRGVHGQSQ